MTIDKLQPRMIIDMAFMDEHEKFLADRLHSDNRSVSLKQRHLSSQRADHIRSRIAN